MQSKKRFTETNIWDAPFFMELTPKQKLAWFFINDRCDNIGVWTPNPKLIAFNLDIEGKPGQFLQDFLKAVNEKEQIIHVMPSGEWLIANFVKFQYCQSKPLHQNNPAHKSYLRLIRQWDLSEWFYLNFPETLPESFIKQHLKNSKRPLKEPFETHKEKDKDKEEEKDTEKEKAQEKEKDLSINSDLEPFTNFSP